MHDASKVVNPEVGVVRQLEGATPRRIAVIGRGGAGKTTVALRLGRELGVPVVHLDRLYWGPDWQSVDPHVFGERQLAAIAGDAWVIDGGYLASDGWEARIERADVVVLVEAPLTVCLRRILRRSMLRSGRRRPDLPDGCDETFSLFFLRWTIGWNRRHQEALARIERIRPVLRVTGAAQVRKGSRVPYASQALLKAWNDAGDGMDPGIHLQEAGVPVEKWSSVG